MRCNTAHGLIDGELLAVDLLHRKHITFIGYLQLEITGPLVDYQMERKSKFMLASLILLLIGALVMVEAFWQSIDVGYPVGLASALLGAIFWVNAE